MQQDYWVVINEEEQYSIWPTGKEVPAGWSTVGQSAAKDACLAEIERLWVDMRPRSLREAMNRAGTEAP
jgi:MbtH protein